MKTTSRFAVASAAGLFMGGIALTPAQAADLGGDCCADLEERVAELEATTVRKGNRVMSVKLSGQVHKAVMWWDDGDEENVYVVDADNSSTRFRITGDANWRPGWKIGFNLEFEAQNDATSNGVTATNDDAGNGDTFTERQAHWWIKSDKLGKLSVGQLSTASDATAEVNLSGGTVASSSLNFLHGAGFALVESGVVPAVGVSGSRSAVTFGNLSPGDIDGLSRQDGVRYDSPTFAGFTLSTGWYEDDAWDVALRYAKQWNSVLFAAAFGYFQDRERLLPFCAAASPVNATNGGGDDADCEGWNASASILHQPTGLFATVAGGVQTDDNRDLVAFQNGIAAGVSVDDDADFIYVAGGIYRRFNEWGKTSIGVDYYDGNCGYGSCGERFGAGAAGGTSNGALHIGSTSNTIWSAWLVQNIDNAATELYIHYQNEDPDIDFIDNTGANVSDVSYDDIHILMAGARVKF